MRRFLIPVLVVVTAGAALAAAQPIDPKALPGDPVGAVPIPASSDFDLPENWGVDDFAVIDYGWANMRPISSDGTWAYSSYNYIHNTGGGTSWSCGSLDAIPNGAKLQLIGAYHYDDSVGQNLTFELGRAYSTNSWEAIAYVTPDHSGGYALSWWDLGLGHTVNHYNSNYTLCLSLPSSAGAIKFRSFKLLYRRQVSPAPATATFNDVPTGHIFFQYVEALANSGITAGCGSGNFCPDSPLTRGQMAVFLAKALGLHYPAF